jgi:hypothetical protein
MTGWARELALGVRLAAGGGREGWLRAALTAVGVGLGVAALLAAVSVPAMAQARGERQAARQPVDEGLPEGDAARRAGRAAVLMEWGGQITFRDDAIDGYVVQPEGPDAPVPPGVKRLPGPGELVVSPALRDLLESSDGALLRPRLPGRIAGIIADEGLTEPAEYFFYRGSDRLAGADNPTRVYGFGTAQEVPGNDPLLWLLIAVGAVVLLVPIGVFMAAAVRFGGERRDRRLAALRLFGADAGMTRRVAAGEALLGSALGVLTGGLLFVAGRPLVAGLRLLDLGVFTADVRPHPVLATLLAVAVPVAAVAVTLLSMRRVVVEPLGVVRRAGGVRRRLWWRLVPPTAALALLLPLTGGAGLGGANTAQVTGGVTLVLVGVTTLLPWLLEAVVRWLGGSGAVPFQLAVRRLQLDGGAAVRSVAGITVALAGGIALQTLYGAIEARMAPPPDFTAEYDVTVAVSGAGLPAPDVEAVLAHAPGVRAAEAHVVTDGARIYSDGTPDDRGRYAVQIGSCTTLRRLAPIERCADGDVFLATDQTGAPLPRPGERLAVGAEQRRYVWRVPETARTVEVPPWSPDRRSAEGVLVTPAAAGAVLPRYGKETIGYVWIDRANPDAYEHVANAAAGLAETASVYRENVQVARPSFASARRGVVAAVVATLLFIGAGLLVAAVEQLRDRRRLLAVLVAFGARRATLAWSVLWQAAMPVVLGTVVAAGLGTALGAVLLAIAGEPATADWAAIGVGSGAAVAVALLVTLLAMPVLWRLMRPDGLRTE